MAANPRDRPADTAASRIARAGALLAALGIASSLFAILRLVETWRVRPPSASRAISLLGAHLSYPVANLAGVVVVGLALLGAAAIAASLVGAARELVAARRFRRHVRGERSPLLGGALLIPDDRPRAFCAGLVKPRVYVSTGALDALDESALQAVLAHERHHARRRDPLRLASARVLARALFFVPGLAGISARHSALTELSADESAVHAAAANRAGLARAMLSFSDASTPDDPLGIELGRVDYLLGEPPSWSFPVLLCLAAASTVVLLLGVAVLAGSVASGSATLAPPVLSTRPCVVVLAMIPVVLRLSVARLRRRISPRPAGRRGPEW